MNEQMPKLILCSCSPSLFIRVFLSYCLEFAAMDLFSYAEWQRLKDFHVELGIIGMGFFALVIVLAFFLYTLRGKFTPGKLVNNPYLMFVYASFIKPHERNKDGDQQSALESFYSAQVG